MNKNTIPNIYKWLCTLLVAVSVLLICTGGLTVADKDSRRSLKKEMKETLREMDVDNKDIKKLQEQLDNWNIDINAKKIIKQLQNIAKTFSDAKISTFELAVNGPSLLSFTDEMEDYARLGSMFGVIPNSVMDTIDDARTVIWFGIILFYVTVVVGIVTVILHIANKKSPGVLYTVISLIWMISLAVASHKINVMGEDELYLDEDLVAITSGVVWAFILAALACMLWIFRDTILGMIGKFTGVSYVTSAVSVSDNVCPNCGKVLGPNAVFCTGCGTRFTPPEPAADDEDKSLFCPNCGAAVTSDSDFCTKCGTKLT